MHLETQSQSYKAKMPELPRGRWFCYDSMRSLTHFLREKRKKQIFLYKRRIWGMWLACLMLIFHPLFCLTEEPILLRGCVFVYMCPCVYEDIPIKLCIDVIGQPQISSSVSLYPGFQDRISVLPVPARVGITNIPQCRAILHRCWRSKWCPHAC